MTDTYVKQVGGKHYETAKPGEQHWDLMEGGDIAYLEATATKYLARWRKKGTPRLDLEKAASYLEKAIACRPGQGARRLVTPERVDDWAAANGIHWMDRDLVKLIISSGSAADLAEARDQVLAMAEGQS